MQKSAVMLLLGALIAFAPLVTVVAAPASHVYYVCNCKDDCACNTISKTPGKCTCGSTLVAVHLLAIEKDAAVFCRCGADCMCQLSKTDPGKCGCGQDVKKVSLKGRVRLLVRTELRLRHDLGQARQVHVRGRSQTGQLEACRSPRRGFARAVQPGSCAGRGQVVTPRNPVSHFVIQSRIPSTGNRGGGQTLMRGLSLAPPSPTGIRKSGFIAFEPMVAMTDALDLAHKGILQGPPGHPARRLREEGSRLATKGD